LTHQVSIVEYRQLSDGQVAVLAQCCSEAKTGSWLTMDARIVIDPVASQASINEHCQRIATQHESMQQALAILPSLVGTSTSVTVGSATPPAAQVPAPAVTTSTAA
jgi:hypothetical protein